MKLTGIKIPGFDAKDGKVSENRKAKRAKLPVSARIAARKNETDKQRIGSRAMAQSLPELERTKESDPAKVG